MNVRGPETPARTLARALFGLLEDVPEAAPALAAARDIAATTARRVPLHGNVDLALAVLTASTRVLRQAGAARGRKSRRLK